MKYFVLKKELSWIFIKLNSLNLTIEIFVYLLGVSAGRRAYWQLLLVVDHFFINVHILRDALILINQICSSVNQWILVVGLLLLLLVRLLLRWVNFKVSEDDGYVINHALLFLPSLHGLRHQQIGGAVAISFVVKLWVHD